MSPSPAITLSPTLAFIERAGATVYLSCDPCRALVAMDVATLVKAFRGDCRIDDAPLTCPKCGALGVAWVTGKGNATVGRAHYWPPTEHQELTPSD